MPDILFSTLYDVSFYSVRNSVTTTLGVDENRGLASLNNMLAVKQGVAKARFEMKSVQWQSLSLSATTAPALWVTSFSSH